MKHTNINKLLFSSFFIFLSLCIISGCGVKGPLIENMPIEDSSD
ncbi:MAG: lipoprotein [SAR86 cluster bacterium]|nr:lipoprotein [SAR86 cluster bacterium]MDG1948987.1 lipoprotein [SAR86 cluster bacterium]MDG2092293.1 lipoprotein [SAR86 cluster bacterium]